MEKRFLRNAVVAYFTSVLSAGFLVFLVTIGSQVSGLGISQLNFLGSAPVLLNLFMAAFFLLMFLLIGVAVVTKRVTVALEGVSGEIAFKFDKLIKLSYFFFAFALLLSIGGIGIVNGFVVLPGILAGLGVLFCQLRAFSLVRKAVR